MMSEPSENPKVEPVAGEESLSIEDIIAEDAKDMAAEDRALRRSQNPDRAKKSVILGLGGTAIVGLVALMVLWNPFGGEQNVGDGKQNMTPGSSQQAPVPTAPRPSDALNPDDFYTQDGLFFPIKMETWQTKEHRDQDQADLDAAVLKSMASTEVAKAANSLPSEASGYTSKSSDQLRPDGTLNPKYSYWTAETFTTQAGEDIERLLNPTFGGWAANQYASHPGNTQFNLNGISDMFTNRWVVANSGKKFSEYVPVYADWTGNDYGLGDNLLTSGPRWYGQVTGSTSEFAYDNVSQQYVVTMVANVKFTAWAKDQSKLEKTGVLTLKFVSNATGLNGSNHTVLIDDASLKVDG